MLYTYVHARTMHVRVHVCTVYDYSSTSRQDQSGYELRSRQSVAPVASNNSLGRVEQQLLIDLNDRQTAAYNAIKCNKISINERSILTATSTHDKALQLISNLKTAFHAYHTHIVCSYLSQSASTTLPIR